MSRSSEFTRATMIRALSRQGHKCASCGERISELGNPGRASHRFGECAQAHHILSLQRGGSSTMRNCAILCQSCHYSAHEGGAYRHGMVRGRPSEYPHYRG
jgi:5-methylcytosine-specific restriction endonuclease McrA